MIFTRSFALHEICPYVNWIYFFHSWGFEPKYAAVARLHDCPACRQAWVEQFTTEDERAKAKECVRLYADAKSMLGEWVSYRTWGKCGLFVATPDGDDVRIKLPDGELYMPFLRQQTTHRAGEPCLCLSDFLNPAGDTLGVFATTVDAEMEHLYPEDAYRHMLVQLLCDRLAEATAEVLHLQVRKQDWGYAPDERLSVDELLLEKYQGIRPAVGYPSLPDQSFNFLIEKAIGMSSICIHLTESGAMQPHASVSGLMFSHPQSRYFAIGRIGRDQLADYAQRRGLPEEEIEKYLIRNLS